MAFVKSVTIFDDFPNGALRERRYLVTITNNSGGDEEYVLPPVVVDVSDDGSISGAKKLASLAENETESGLDVFPEYQDQNDYDRLSLGKAMLITDIDDFHIRLPLFKAMELRGGANASQRAVYLGVLLADYNLMADRFGDDEGVAFFIDNAKGQVWDELPVEWT